MVVNNAQGETAIVIRRDGQIAVFVRLKTGKLTCERLTEVAFRETWHESAYSLPGTIERLLDHGRNHGYTQEALRGLTKLKERDLAVISSLF